MARRKKPRLDDEKVESRLEELEQLIDKETMEGIDIVFATDLLREYASLAEMAYSCRQSIESDGILIESTSGAKDNRHVKLIENPAFATYYKITSRMGDLAQKTSRFMKQSVAAIEEEEEQDGIAAFIRR